MNIWDLEVMQITRLVVLTDTAQPTPIAANAAPPVISSAGWPRMGTMCRLS